MNYVLLCPKGSMKNVKEEIADLGGFWNGIGYAFPPGSKEIIKEWLGEKTYLALIEPPLKETWNEYKEFCRKDWEYQQLMAAKLENFCLEQTEAEDEKGV